MLNNIRLLNCAVDIGLRISGSNLLTLLLLVLAPALWQHTIPLFRLLQESFEAR